MGNCYRLGIGIEKDYQKAFFFYNHSVENGYIEANFQLGYCYVNGIGTEVNKEKGFMLYNQAARIQNSVQIIIESEEETANDLEKVNYWYHKSSTSLCDLLVFLL